LPLEFEKSFDSVLVAGCEFGYGWNNRGCKYLKGISKNSTSLINQGIEVLLSCKLLIVNNLCLFVLL